ncbi:DNA polymerase III subunit gamma and tau [Brachybacterium halotolerans subsp. kimchii]|uniref:DNA polymerase III subunit gamma and tau n=1 Tax=Brachybacterium halotolerans TaxID=2795215 RepID=UPI001E37659E|nr:DNA polymerase III subunit gamma and tau [Brachybacterium halotolerans]UEJ84372.1 DNA polymerase III subunit gamma and tau [Brachybacterium halotolerans subsp. kimchii]
MVTALYRRYRPESFAEVIGQDHVTVPLMRALRNGRVGHAYLFSGPRGCGKTTSARILARCLNCEQGPTDTPCGECDSCRDLARNGPGSLDVVEIDAASHGGVDDARELRERATFAPARDRYKVFIIDEAHMVTSAGFNALLKLVEEPPEHVKFVFATTEPDKVIGTIRSRTHHYPFRLIPPQILTPYLEQVCAAEGVQVGEGVLPLVVRAGGGSARDTMSVLDQLMAGAGEDGVDYETAISLLGFTDTSLLDEAITAIGQRDAGTLYRAIERVLETGHEPRRFVEDLLERLRDLIVLAAVPERGHELLPEVPDAELERMREQVGWFPVADLSLSGDLVNQALSTMSGATSPRLHLELLAARLLLRGQQVAAAPVAGAAPGGAPSGAAASAPGASGAGAAGAGAAGGAPAGRSGAAAARAALPNAGGSAQSGEGQGRTAQGGGAQAGSGREEARRIAQQHSASGQSRSASAASAAPAPAAAPAPGPESSRPAAEQPPRPAVDEPSSARSAQPAPAAAPTDQEAEKPQPESGASAGAVGEQSAPAADDDWGPVAAIPGSATTGTRPAEAPGSDAPQPEAAPAQPSAPAQGADGQPDQAAQPASGGGAQEVREHWSAILEALQQIRRPSWALVSQHAHVADLSGGRLTISFRSGGLLSAFGRGTGAENLAQAVRKIMHQDVTVEAVLDENPSDDGPAGGSGGGSGPAGGNGPASGNGPTGGSGPGGAASGPGGGASGAPAAPAPRGAQGEGQNAPRGTDAPGRQDPRSQGSPARPQASSQPSAQSSPQAAPQNRPAAEAGGRAPRGGTAPWGDAAPHDDFPPEPDDDPYPPEPEDSYPPDPRDSFAPGPADRPVARPASARGTAAPGTPGPETTRTSPAPSNGSPAQGSADAQDASVPDATAQDAAETSPAQTGEVLEVHDEGRDTLSGDVPRTHGQAALKKAIESGRPVRSLPPVDGQGDSASDGSGGDNIGGDDGAGGISDSGISDSGDDAQPPVVGEASAPEPDPVAAPSAPSASYDADWSSALSSVAPPAGSATSAAPAPSAASAVSASAPPSAASAAPASAPSAPAPSAQSAASASSAAPAPATRSTGAALAREAVLASRSQPVQRRGSAAEAPPEPDAQDEDPTGGATWYDEDVDAGQVATRSGREIAETVLGGKVLEIIDETR